MRNMKKFLALVLAVLMVFSMAVITTGAADTADYTEAAQHLAALKILKGDENGNLMLDSGVTRYQAALFFVQAITGKTDVSVWNADKQSAVFSDVVEYGTAIDYAYGVKVVLGRGNGVYGYSDAIIYQDMLVMAVRALGYEEDGMSYPYGYILAAQKLGLTDDVDLVNYKAALTRGETAQIIWNMLQTQVAETDVLTGKILYPDETGLTGTLLDTEIERTTLLEEAGFADGKIETTITAFTEADDDDEDSVDTVTLDGVDADITAADLGITADTPKVSYLGLPVTLFVDCAADDFATSYADGDATIVFADFETYTTVENLGNAGNIKYDESKEALTLGGTKYTAEKYDFVVYTFSADGWTEAANADDITTNFAYTTKDGYTAESGNTYGKVQYRVIAAESSTEKGTVEILYTPYDFGQYNTRELKYTPDSKKYNFTTIAVYDETSYTNFDGDTTNFVEYYVGKAGTSSAKVTSSTTSVSKSNGAAAKSVTLAGESVKAGDFIFYDYNSVDNILTVAQNIGTFKTGRLTGQTVSKETVKIDGANYGFGFKGVFTTDVPSTWDDYKADVKTSYIEALESGKDNVKYLLADGNIVYMEPCSETADEAEFDFAIISLDETKVADVLGISATKFANAAYEFDDSDADLYVTDNGVAVAVLNKTTGKWELGYIKAVDYDYDSDDADFNKTADIATLVKYASMFDDPTDYKDYAKLKVAFDTLNDGPIYAVSEEANGVYTLASNLAANGTDTTDVTLFTSVENTDGLLFSTNGKTNAITADEDVTAARITMNANTVIVFVDKDGNVGVRVGVQTSKRDIAGTVDVYAASSALIVVAAGSGNNESWGDKSTTTVVSTENYYVALEGVSANYDVLDDDTFELTITNLFDLKNLKKVDSIVITGDVDDADSDLIALDTIGTVLYQDEEGTVTVSDKTLTAALLALNEDYAALDLSGFELRDSDTIVGTIDGVEITAGKAVSLAITVATLDLTGLDTDDYDFDRLLTDVAYVDGTYDDAYFEIDGYYAYVIDGDTVEEITEPVAGVFDQFIIDNNEITVSAPETDADDYAGAVDIDVTVTAIATYDDSTDAVSIIVLKVLTPNAD